MNWQCPSLSLSHGLTRSLYRKFMSRPSTFTQSPALQFYLFSLFCVASTEILWIKPISGQENLRSKELHPKSEMQLAFWKQQRISDRAGRVIVSFTKPLAAGTCLAELLQTNCEFLSHWSWRSIVKLWCNILRRDENMYLCKCRGAAILILSYCGIYNILFWFLEKIFVIFHSLTMWSKD